MKLNLAKKWKVRAAMAVITLALSAVGIVLTPAQVAVIEPAAQALVEYTTVDENEIEHTVDVPPPPFIEPEPEPPKEESGLGKVIISSAIDSFIKNTF